MRTGRATRKSGRSDAAGIVIFGIVLLSLWLKCLTNIFGGDFMGYENQFGQWVGTYLLLVILLISTPIYTLMVVRVIRIKRVRLYPHSPGNGASRLMMPWE